MLSEKAVYFKKLLMNTLDCTASDLASEVVGGQYDTKVAGGQYDTKVARF